MKKPARTMTERQAQNVRARGVVVISSVELRHLAERLRRVGDCYEAYAIKYSGDAYDGAGYAAAVRFNWTQARWARSLALDIETWERALKGPLEGPRPPERRKGRAAR
jgi:hypothetical protein